MLITLECVWRRRGNYRPARFGPIPVAIEGGEALADSYLTVET